MVERLEEEKRYIGFKALGFKGGEEIVLLKGVDAAKKPLRVIVEKEYKKYLLVDMEFEIEKEKGCSETIHRKSGVNKGALLCGDVLVRRFSDLVILTGDEVGIPCGLGCAPYKCGTHSKKPVAGLNKTC